jgi:hypothetical protein
MISFNNRFIQKVTILAKLIPVGLKFQGLGDGGYIYSWEVTRPKLAEFRATVTVHFSRNEKEFFPGMFWAIGMILINY